MSIQYIEVEAREWLELNERSYPFASNEFTRDEILDIIQELYDGGAEKVHVIVYSSSLDYSDTLRVYVHPQRLIEILKVIIHLAPHDFSEIDEYTFDLWWD